MGRRWAVAATAAICAAAVAAAPSAPARATAPARTAGDVVVVAVIDDGLTPYHWDYLAAKMPQHATPATADDLPLGSPPHTWLPGFGEPGDFDVYAPVRLSLEPHDAAAPIARLDAGDRREWRRMRPSSPRKLRYYWFPGTKIVGALDFGGAGMRGSPYHHGTGTTSVLAGNLHGTCPECLLVFLSFTDAASAERAIEWALAQPWIDVVSNSYGHSDLGIGKVYSGSDVGAQKRAIMRGQTVFFSGGNGVDNSFIVPNSTYYSSQKGPDWLITVGAVSPHSHGAYAGAGKPVDVAGSGDAYPSAYTATTVGGTGEIGFSGSSNAAPTVAGMYARALYEARAALGGPSRVQRGGVIASGGGVRCGPDRRSCELGDGILTATELRLRVLHGAVHTSAGATDPLGIAPLPPVGEDEYVSEGHGTYFARTYSDADWRAEFDRIVGPLFGTGVALRRPRGERDWMMVDSFCRQEIWGPWTGGYYVQGRTELPGPDPRWPVRSALEAACPHLLGP